MSIPSTIPVDVMEHFRERTFPVSITLNGAPLTNYAETLSTARDTKGKRWGHYQQILIGSCFAALRNPAARRQLALELWASIDNPNTPRAVTLVLTGLAISSARALLWSAPLKAITRAFLTILRRPGVVARLKRQASLAAELDFLTCAPLTAALAAKADLEAHHAR